MKLFMAMNLLTNWLAVEQVQYPYLSMHVQVVGGTGVTTDIVYFSSVSSITFLCSAYADTTSKGTACDW